MKKGKYGFSLSLVALLCIAFAILKQPVAVLLIAAYAILAEKDEILNKSVLSTVVIMVINIFINILVNGLFNSIITLANSAGVIRVMRILNSLTNSFVFIVFLALYIILAISTMKGKNLKVPFVDKAVSPKEETPKEE